MRATRRIGTVLLCLVLLAGCAATSTSTTAPTAVPTSSPMPADTLPDWILPYLHVGVSSLSIPYLLDDANPFLDKEVYRLASGGVVRLGYDRESEDLVIVSVQKEGEAAITPPADTSPVLDFRVDLGGLVFIPGGDVTIDAMEESLGTPLHDETVEVTEVAYGDSPHWFRTLTFPGRKVKLRQLLDATDESVWTFDGVDVSARGILSARGLAVGMEIAGVLDRYGVAGLSMELSGSEAGLESIRVLRYIDFTSENATIDVSFANGKVDSWSVFIDHSD